MALIKFWRRLGLKHNDYSSLTRGESIPCFMCRYSSIGGPAQYSRFQERSSLMMQTLISTLTLRKFFGGGGLPRPGGGNVNFWSYGRGILWRKQNGSPRRISVIRTHSRRMFVQARFPRSNRLCPVFENRNFSRGGEVVGNLGPSLGLPWAPVWHGAVLVPVSQIGRGPVAVAWGGLHVGYQ